MVEPTPKTQLPASTAAVEEESKEMLYMYGDVEAIKADIVDKLENADLNMLERGLLMRHLENPSANREQICTTLIKAINRLSQTGEDEYSVRKLQKIHRLFMIHEFWNEEPVPQYSELVSPSQFN